MAPSKQSKAKKEPTTTRTTQLLFSNPLEEYCLRLLLHHPELVNMSESLLPEYFKNSQNREIFIAWQKIQDLSSLKENLDSALWEQVESLISIDVIDNKAEDKLASVIIRLRKQYLRDQEEERAAAFAAVAEDAGSGADLTKLQEDGIEATTQLKQVFEQEARGHRSR